MSGRFAGVVAPLPLEEQFADVVAVLCDAFHDYPVMRFVLGAEAPAFDRRLPVLIGLFVRARLLRGDPVFGAQDAAGHLVGVATLTAPGDRRVPPEFAAERAATWRALGEAERGRYEAFAAASDRHKPPGPHYYLNMLGVRSTHAGSGFGRRLLDGVHALSQADAVSTGMALSTEDPRNLPLYEHVGYRTLGHARVGPGLETWTLWRPDAVDP